MVPIHFSAVLWIACPISFPILLVLIAAKRRNRINANAKILSITNRKLFHIHAIFCPLSQIEKSPITLRYHHLHSSLSSIVILNCSSITLLRLILSVILASIACIKIREIQIANTIITGAKIILIRFHFVKCLFIHSHHTLLSPSKNTHLMMRNGANIIASHKIPNLKTNTTIIAINGIINKIAKTPFIRNIDTVQIFAPEGRPSWIAISAYPITLE